MLLQKCNYHDSTGSFNVITVTKSQLCLCLIIKPTLVDCLCQRMHTQHIFYNVLVCEITCMCLQYSA